MSLRLLEIADAKTSHPTDDLLLLGREFACRFRKFPRRCLIGNGLEIRQHPMLLSPGAAYGAICRFFLDGMAGVRSICWRAGVIPAGRGAPVRFPRNCAMLFRGGSPLSGGGLPQMFSLSPPPRTVFYNDSTGTRRMWDVAVCEGSSYTPPAHLPVWFSAACSICERGQAGAAFGQLCDSEIARGRLFLSVGCNMGGGA